jgi:hypothetical protein
LIVLGRQTCCGTGISGPYFVVEAGKRDGLAVADVVALQ